MKSLTIAPESGSDNIRKKIGKRITNDQIHQFITQAHQNQITQFKLYFILGLTQDPVNEAKNIIDLVDNILSSNPGLRLNVSITPLIPKTGTKLGNEHVNYKTIQIGFDALKKNLRKKVKYKTFPLAWAASQAILSQGGRELLPQLLEIAQRGGSQQSWHQTLGMAPINYYQDNYTSD